MGWGGNGGWGGGGVMGGSWGVGRHTGIINRPPSAPIRMLPTGAQRRRTVVDRTSMVAALKVVGMN